MQFRRIALVAVAATLAFASPAAAEQWDLKTVKCEAFLTFDKNTTNILLAWLDAYYKDEDDPPVIDLAKYLANAQKLGEYCRANPSHSLITATDELFGK
jgi:acid stress chaperone HdeB